MTTAQASSPKNSQPDTGLDGTDLAILAELAADGRITNSTLAARVGIAESTCAYRMRALRDSGVIEGIHARLDPAALGCGMQAIIKVRLGSHKRHDVLRLHGRLTSIPGVLTAFHLAGEDDYLLHVAVASPTALRDLVLEHLTAHPSVQHTETQLVFEVLPGMGVIPSVHRGRARADAPAPPKGSRSPH